jgi:hypothetical protein
MVVDAPGHIVKAIRAGSTDILGERLRIEPERGPKFGGVLVTLAREQDVK